MEYKNIDFFMRVFSSKSGLDSFFLFKTLLNNPNFNFDIEEFRKELAIVAADDHFDMVGLACEVGFVTAHEELKLKMEADNLIMFTDSMIFPIMKQRFQYTTLEIQDVKDSIIHFFRTFDAEPDIFELMKFDILDQLPFDVKCMYYRRFLLDTFTKNDIIYHIKSIVGDRFYPYEKDENQIFNIGVDADSMIRKNTDREGWIDMMDVIRLLRDKYADIELYDLYHVKWSEDIELIPHYRNSITMGFRRLKAKNDHF